ncbi:MAG: hypothetical protein LBT25_07840 [Candidatus Symbiothrix sp.]|jgi:hypothetical protein|nr:hypothetical protein [Candidatus Symbiothrix sp.]
MQIGIVKWFDSEKGFGVLGDPKEEFFLHINNFINKPKNLSDSIDFFAFKGTVIIFEKKFDKKKNRNIAEQCRLVGELNDWNIILRYLDTPDKVSIEVEETRYGNRGNSYKYKEFQNFSLMNLAAKQFFKKKTDDEILSTITNYFDNELNNKYFFNYCELIENSIQKSLKKEQATTLLKDIFTHFGNNLNEETLFHVWKDKKFKFISYTEINEYEIPQKVLKNFITEISIAELKRIKDFSYGSEFCNDFVNSKFCNISSLNFDEIKSLYLFLEFTNEEEREKHKVQLDSFYAQKIINEIIEQTDKFDVIENNDDFYNYNELNQIIPSQISEEKKIKIKTELNKIIASKCSEEYKSELWIKGIIEDVPFEFISTTFLDGNTESDKRTIILSKLQLNQQLELLKSYSERNSFEKAFETLETLVKEENILGYDFKLSENLFNTEFWKEKRCNGLVNLFVQYVNEKSNDRDKYELFFKGLIKNISQTLVKQNIGKLSKSDCRKIFESQSENKSYILEILQDKVLNKNISSIDWVYSLGEQYLDKTDFSQLDKNVFNSIEQKEYFNFWKIGKGKIFPKDYVEGSILNDNYGNYKQIEEWIQSKVISRKKINNILFSYLCEQILVTDRIIFHKQFNRIKYLLENDKTYLDKIKEFKNDFYEVILWFLDIEESFNFETLKHKFIYFHPNEQVRIIKKLFFLKAQSRFDLTVEKLDELIRFDLDLYKTSLSVNSTIPIDISTDMIIKSLLSYQKEQKFLTESELLTIILKDLNNNKTEDFEFKHYFENCGGRYTAEFNWNTNGKITKRPFGNNQFYFAIEFSTGKQQTHNVYYKRSGRSDTYTEFVPNTNFEKLKESVKLLPERKWNGEKGHWSVPAIYEQEVMLFAKNNHFFLDFEENNYKNNTHLAKFEREDKPNGIMFCEGRLANKQHEMFNQDFWWCAGQPCFEKCETIHSPDDWEHYTLLDFCEILGFDTDEINRMDDFISKGRYYQFIGVINRFNQLLEKLSCSDCNELLYPIDTSHFAAYTVVRFHCINENCNNHKEIYLNHCLNGQCNSIIDSRDSKECSNGLYICDKCGSCCSHAMLSRRLSNLELTGGYIHPNLRKCVNEKLGHLERAEYFCYKCRGSMKEISTDVFYCNNCYVKYDTTKYKFNRIHRHLQKIS